MVYGQVKYLIYSHFSLHLLSWYFFLSSLLPLHLHLCHPWLVCILPTPQLAMPPSTAWVEAPPEEMLVQGIGGACPVWRGCDCWVWDSSVPRGGELHSAWVRVLLWESAGGVGYGWGRAVLLDLESTGMGGRSLAERWWCVAGEHWGCGGLG